MNNAFAGGEQNASGEKIVTAPTCGSSGIVPTVLYYQQQKNDFSDDCIVRALMTAGVVGSLIKTKLKIYCLMQKNMISICFFLSSGAII
ncbi:MAG: L-serine ammonia-lyase, iron-sulfur-dependent, subunit alpha [Clostridia bacterium]|nr:L-serine ammonia-lyase, iron-sulfur-dependent, subunit alpha [Clostridia bacterium]